ncbi:MAG: hypothetical protein ACI8VE_000579 [Natrialbaceae archaeon]|jgi:hypothetical protein
MSTHTESPDDSKADALDSRRSSGRDSSLGFRDDAFEQAIQSGGEADQTFETILKAIEGWRNRTDQTTVRQVSQALKRTLERELNGDAETEWEKDVIETPHGQSTSDIVINGAIGVGIVRDLNTNTASEFRQRLRGLCQQYTHLLLFAYQLPSEDIDQWRMLAKGLQASNVGVERVATVESFKYGRSESPDVTTAQRGKMVRKRGPEAVTLLFALGLIGGLLQKLVGWLPTVGVEMRVFFVMMTVFYLAVLLFGVAYIRVFT